MSSVWDKDVVTAMHCKPDLILDKLFKPSLERFIQSLDREIFAHPFSSEHLEECVRQEDFVPRQFVPVTILQSSFPQSS